MATNSKNKGSTFERKIANLLSERFANYTGLEKSFIRNSDSGSYFGGKNSVRTSTHDLDKATFGDIVVPKGFKYSLECKHYANPPSFKMWINQDCKLLEQWISQAKQDSKAAGKDFLLIMKFNGISEIVLLEDVPEGLDVIINYRVYSIVRLDDFLKLEDKVFWS